MKEYKNPSGVGPDTQQHHPPVGKSGRVIQAFKGMTSTVLAACVGGALLVSVAHAQEAVKATVLFQEDASAAEIDDYTAYWEAAGVSVVMHVPFINGVVLSVPSGISSADLADDPIVMDVEGEQQMELQAIQAAGEGGAGEGGAGEGGAGEGGAGEGGAQSFIEQFDEPDKSERPWGVLNLSDHPHDPSLYTDFYHKELVPDLVETASKKTKEIKIAIFDTGIDINHQKLDQLVKGGIDLVDFTSAIPTDDNGHGTHVAGTLAGKELGMMEKVELYSVRILDGDAAGDVSSLVMALQWAVDNDIDVVNMSIGFREDNPAVRVAVQRAYDAGLIMVAAVGNHSNWEDDGASGEGGAGEGGAGEGGAGEGGAGEGGAGEGGAGDSCVSAMGEGGAGEGGAGEGGAGEGGAGEGGAGADCATGNQYSVMYPAAYPEVIAVAAIDSDGELAWFSNTGPEIDLLAPGVDIVSANVGDSYGVANGTSMASPHVTAAVALMLGLALDQGKTLTPSDVKQILTETAMDGIVNLVDALNEVDAL